MTRVTREALVVGINDYPFLEDKQARKLKTPAGDAEAIAQMLEKHGNFHVGRFPVEGSEGAWKVDRDPDIPWTAKGLEDAITQLFDPPGGPLDTALLFFAGHGLRKPGTTSEGFLATSDAIPKKGRWGVSLRWLRKLLERSPVRQQIVWLDCCYSGEFLNFKEADPGIRGKNRNRCFIAASRQFEQAFPQFDGKHGVLSGALLEALEPSQRADGLVTNYVLTDHIEKKLRSARQRPVWKNWGGEIILTGTRQKIDNPVLMGICPYKGLEYFNESEEDARFFYGRQRLTEELLDKVDRGNFLAVLGSSGVGKSSLVRAGLLYQLRQGRHLAGSDEWDIRIFRPGERPLRSLAAAFADPNLPETMVNRGGVGLNDLVARINAPRVVLVADQFEEAFTLCQDREERQQFFECLLGAVREPDAKLCVVLAMRADFFSKCTELEYAGLARQIQEHLVTVTPMSAEELKEAIFEPAKQVGLEVERELVTRIIDDVKNAPGSLPLVQYALTELWKQRELNCLRLAKYTELGGVKGALEQRAGDVYLSLSPVEQKVAKRIFLELTHLGEGTEDTRRQVFLEDLATQQQSQGSVEEVIKKLADEKLVVTGEVKAFGGARAAVVDVAHEKLIRNWSLLRGWLNESRDAMRRKREIEDEAREWRSRGKPKDAAYLLQGTKLNLAEDFLKSQADTLKLSGVGREFVDRSIQHRRNSRNILWVAVIGVTALLSGAAIFATYQWREANSQRIKANKNATIISLGEKADIVRYLLSTIEPVRGLVLAIQAAGEDKAQLQQFRGSAHQDENSESIAQVQDSVQDSLLRGIQTVREQNLLQRHKGSVNAVAFSPDGKYIVSGGEDRTLRLWDRNGQPKGEPLRGHQDTIWTVAVSPDGEYIVSGSKDRTLRLWNRKGEPISELLGHQDEVNAVAISPDGEYIVSGSNDRTLRLWNRNGQPIRSIRGHVYSVLAVAFSPDGRYIVTGSADNTLRLWNRNGQLIRPFIGHKHSVSAVAFSPDGEYIVSGSWDNTLRLWNLQGKQIGEPWHGHQGRIWSVAFSPDGEHIVSGSADRTLRLWSIKGERVEKPLHSHTDTVWAVAFRPDGESIVSASSDRTLRLWKHNRQLTGFPIQKHDSSVTAVAISLDGQYIVSGSKDKTLRLWNLKGEEQIGSPMQGHKGSVTALAISPNGQYIVSGSEDRVLRLWNLKGEEQIGSPMQGHRGSVTALAISPNGDYIVSGSDDKTLRLWNFKGEQMGEPFRGHNGSVTALAISPDGQYIASGSQDKTLRLWNLKGKQIREPFRGHEDSVTALAIGQDGEYIVSGSSDRTLRLWNRKGQPVDSIIPGNRNERASGSPIRGHDDSVTAVAISLDGKYIVSGSEDKILRLWNHKGQPIGNPLRGHEDRVYAVATTSDGRYIVSGSEDKTLRLWPLGWKNWLQIGCSQLKYHLALVQPQANFAREAGETCQKYAWNETDSAQFLLRQGNALARAGDVDGAVAKFEEALKLDANLDLEPEAKAKSIAVSALVEEGYDSAYQGNFNEALEKLQKASNLDPKLGREAEKDAKEDPKDIAVTVLLERGENAFQENDYKAAIEAYSEAYKLEQNSVSAERWSEICLYGSLRGYAEVVIDACENALYLKPNYTEYLKYRGIAKAITEDKEGAIKDFESFIESHYYKSAKRRVQRYIDDLRAGENPFTDAEIKRLLGE